MKSRFIIIRIVIIAVAAFSMMAASADKLTLRPGMTGVPDLGAIQCETFSTMYPFGPTGMRQAALTWAEGYFFAVSSKTIDEILEQQSDDSADWNFDSLTDHIVVFCSANPKARFPEAVQDLGRKLGL